jgi:hypothetical protein
LAVQAALVAAALIQFLALPLEGQEHLGKVLLAGKVLVGLDMPVGAAVALRLLAQITQPRILVALVAQELQVALVALALPMLAVVAVAAALLLVVLGALAVVEAELF